MSKHLDSEDALAAYGGGRGGLRLTEGERRRRWRKQNSYYKMDECSWLTAHLEEKTKALELLIGENQELRTQYEDMRAKANNVEAENKTLIDRWNLQKIEGF
ncbi:hypothetical protein L1887_35300 [Cichorium endivia]|nr:hypothetical protein L1887_35300 [Cichorium endivia]